MILYLASLFLQVIGVFLVVAVIYKVFWTITDIIRMFLYYKCGMKNIFTNQELIDYKMIEPNSIEPDILVLDKEDQTHEEFWDNMNNTLDLQYKQSE